MKICRHGKSVKVWAGVLSAALCFGAAAPGIWAAPLSGTQSVLTANQAATPQGAAQLVMESLKSLDMKAFNTYTDNVRQEGDKTVTMFGGFQYDPNDKEQALEREFVRMLSWKMGTVTVKGDSAIVNMEITNADLSGIIGVVMKDSLKEALKSNPDYGLLEKQMTDRVKEAQKTTITLACAVTLKKTGGIWKVHLDESFVNAVCGNLLKGMEGYAEGMEAFSGALADGTSSAAEHSVDEWMSFGLSIATEALRDQDLQAELQKEIRDALADADVKGEIQRAIREAFQ